MEGVLRWIDRFIQQLAWESLAGRVQWVDWVLVIAIVGGMVYGSRRGLMRELVEILELNGISFVTLEYYPVVAKIFQNVLPASLSGLAYVTGFVLTAGAVWLTLGFVDSYLRKFFRSQLPPRLRRWGGSFLGMIHFVFVWSFISQAVLLTPIAVFQEPYSAKKSYSGEFLARLMPKIHQIISVSSQSSNRS